MYSFCKANSLNVDVVHRWMSSNGIADAGAALAKLKELQELIESPPQRPILKKAA
jgi:hypothetical protein